MKSPKRLQNNRSLSVPRIAPENGDWEHDDDICLTGRVVARMPDLEETEPTILFPTPSVPEIPPLQPALHRIPIHVRFHERFIAMCRTLSHWKHTIQQHRTNRKVVLLGLLLSIIAIGWIGAIHWKNWLNHPASESVDVAYIAESPKGEPGELTLQAPPVVGAANSSHLAQSSESPQATPATTTVASSKETKPLPETVQGPALVVAADLEKEGTSVTTDATHPEAKPSSTSPWDRSPDSPYFPWGMQVASSENAGVSPVVDGRAAELTPMTPLHTTSVPMTSQPTLSSVAAASSHETASTSQGMGFANYSDILPATASPVPAPQNFRPMPPVPVQTPPYGQRESYTLLPPGGSPQSPAMYPGGPQSYQPIQANPSMQPHQLASQSPYPPGVMPPQNAVPMISMPPNAMQQQYAPQYPVPASSAINTQSMIVPPSPVLPSAPRQYAAVPQYPMPSQSTYPATNGYDGYRGMVPEGAAYPPPPQRELY